MSASGSVVKVRRSFAEHLAGTARLAHFHAEQALGVLETLVRRLESGRAHATDYKDTQRALKDAQGLVQFVVRLQHGVMVRDHMSKAEVLLAALAACERQEERSQGKGPAMRRGHVLLTVPTDLIEKIQALLESDPAGLETETK